LNEDWKAGRSAADALGKIATRLKRER